MDEETNRDSKPERPSLDELRIDRRAQERRTPGSLARHAPWLAALLIVAAAAIVWQWPARSASESAEAPEAAAASVDLAAAAERDRTVLDASGYVTARRQATVSSKVTGKIVEVMVEEGMVVEEGQVLAYLDDSMQRAAVALAEASLETARRGLAETEARLAKARLDRERADRLVRQAVVAQADLDSAATELDALTARLALERGRVEVAARELALQRVLLAETVIRAPFAGVAVSKNAQPGEMISPVSAGGGFTRTGVCTLVDMASLEIEVDVGESYIQRVYPGQRVEATLDAYPGAPLPAHVITTIPAADREKATVKVRIGFDRLDGRVLPDMGVKVAFLGDGAEDAETTEETGGER